MLEDIMPKRTKEQSMLSQNSDIVSDLSDDRKKKELKFNDNEEASKPEVKLLDETDEPHKSFDIQTKIDDDLVNATVRTESASDYLTRREDKFKKRSFGRGLNEAYGNKKDSAV